MFWLLLLTAISAAVSIISGIVTIRYAVKSHPGPKPQRQRFSWGLTIGTLLLTLVFFLASILSLQGNSPGNNPTPISGSTQKATGVIPGQETATPSTTPASTLLSSPTSAPKPGDVLCQADAARGWNGWGASGEWQISSNGELINTGTGLGGPPTIVAPCQLGVNDYSVEANIQAVHWQFDLITQFAIVVRGGVSSDGYPQGYSVGMIINGNGYTPEHAAAISKSPGDFMQTLKYAPYNLDNMPHDYLVKVEGNMITFSIDGTTLLTVPDNTFPSGEQVGLWSEDTELTISSIKIIAL